MKKVTIKRSKWMRGTGGGVLWHKETNTGCCLGHICKQISRKTEAELEGNHNPVDVLKGASVMTNATYDDYFHKWNVEDKPFIVEAIIINDKVDMLETDREQQLKTLFRKNGIEVKFVD